MGSCGIAASGANSAPASIQIPQGHLAHCKAAKAMREAATSTAGLDSPHLGLKAGRFWSHACRIANIPYSLHPDPEWPLPDGPNPGNHWIYQNTFVDMGDFADHLDSLMQQAGIPPMANSVR